MAYAKILQETDGTQALWKGKIQTLELPAGPEDFLTRTLVTRRLENMLSRATG